MISALMKPFLPANTGLWFREGSMLNSGTMFPAPAPPTHEVLGWWYIPIMLILGSLTLLVTTFAIQKFLAASHRLLARLQE